ncbi:hypothetical protein BH23THE1_BH23THE1_35440 [soil metagenome]
MNLEILIQYTKYIDTINHGSEKVTIILIINVNEIELLTTRVSLLIIVLIIGLVSVISTNLNKEIKSDTLRNCQNNKAIL